MNLRRPDAALAALCAVCAACVIAEAALRWPSPDMFHSSYLLIPLFALVSLPVLAFAPQAGAWLTVTLYCVGLVSPFPMSYTYTLAMLIALSVIWRRSGRGGPAMACLAGALGVTAMLVDRKLLFGLGLSDSVVVSFAYCMFAIVIGLVSRWQADRDRAREQAERIAERDRVASALHDRISNDLAYAIMRIDRDLESLDVLADAAESERLRALREVVAHALDGTHEVIMALDDRAPEVGKPSDRRVRSATTARLRALIDEREDRLAALGFDGSTMIAADAFDGLDASVAALVEDCVAELYADIGKHADPAHGYAASFARDGEGRLAITVADTPLTGASGDAAKRLGLGGGLTRLRERVDRSGGSMTYGVRDGQWAAEILIKPFPSSC